MSEHHSSAEQSSTAVYRYFFPSSQDETGVDPVVLATIESVPSAKPAPTTSTSNDTTVCIEPAFEEKDSTDSDDALLRKESFGCGVDCMIGWAMSTLEGRDEAEKTLLLKPNDEIREFLTRQTTETDEDVESDVKSILDDLIHQEKADLASGQGLIQRAPRDTRSRDEKQDVACGQGPSASDTESLYDGLSNTESFVAPSDTGSRDGEKAIACGQDPPPNDTEFIHDDLSDTESLVDAESVVMLLEVPILSFADAAAATHVVAVKRKRQTDAYEDDNKGGKREECECATPCSIM